MDILNIAQMEIAAITEKVFTCSICNTSSSVEYGIEINGNKESRHPICLNCHNEIAKQLFCKTKKKSFKY
jgi:hypothetical protein